jgi:hypothetical protein
LCVARFILALSPYLRLNVNWGERSDCLRNAGAKWGYNGNGPARELLASVYEAFTEGFDTHALA